MEIKKHTLNFLNKSETNVFYFLPDIDQTFPKTMVILTHGYTADKSSILNWALRLCEVGVPVALFDLPGHYLGNFSEVDDFTDFTDHAHELFAQAFKELKKHYLESFPLNEHDLDEHELKVVLGGHSLGSLLSLKALKSEAFSKYQRLSIVVGLGMAPKDVVHLFDTPFYKSTLKIREQLVSPALKPDNIFPWIKKEKEEIEIHGERIHFITGVDDLVVGNDGMERLAERFLQMNNTVTMEKPSKLPHHEPELAASHVKKFLKGIQWI